MKINIPLVKEILKKSLSETMEILPAKTIAEMGLPSYLNGNAFSRWVSWRKIKLILKMCGDLQNAYILDFGCGSGILFDSLNQHCAKLYASDIDLVMAKTTDRLLNINKIAFLHPDDLDTVIGDETLDLIIAANVLEHVPSLNECLKLFDRKLKKNGVLVVSGPTENMMYRVGRIILRLMGHRQFTGEYHRTDISRIFHSVSEFNFTNKKTVRFPFSGLLALYWIGRFKTNS